MALLEWISEAWWSSVSLHPVHFPSPTSRVVWQRTSHLFLCNVWPAIPSCGAESPGATLFVALPSLQSMTKDDWEPKALLLLIPNKPQRAQWYMAQWSNWIFQRVWCVFCNSVTLKFSKWWFSTKMKIILFILLKSNNSIHWWHS